MAAGHRWLTLPGLALLGIAAAAPNQRLTDAAKDADWSAVRTLVEQGADVNVPESDGTTALHWAAYWDDGASVDMLLRAGARVNAANDLGVTPLWAACENGSAATAHRLLQVGASPNAALVSGETLLMTAARTGSAEVVRLLLANAADVNGKERARGQTALMWAVAQKHPDVVDLLLAHRADVEARSNVWTQVVKTSMNSGHPAYTIAVKQGGYTPLLFAARVGDLASAKLLVAAGADVNDTAPYGTSATVVAAHSGHGEVAAFLLDKGADPNRDLAGYTALHAALLRKDEKLVKALLIHGANPNAPLLKSTPVRRDSVDFYFHPSLVGATPFWLAARFSTPRIMRLLLEYGGDSLVVHHPTHWVGESYGKFRLRNEGDTTALMAAAGLGGEAQIFAVDHLGRIAERAPLEAQRREPDPIEFEAVTLEAVKVAVEAGVDVNVANADGNTALHAVAARGYDSVISFLVEKGARMDIKNRAGQTALAAAMAKSMTGQARLRPTTFPPNAKTVDLLRKLGAKQ